MHIHVDLYAYCVFTCTWMHCQTQCLVIIKKNDNYLNESNHWAHNSKYPKDQSWQTHRICPQIDDQFKRTVEKKF